MKPTRLDPSGLGSEKRKCVLDFYARYRTLAKAIKEYVNTSSRSLGLQVNSSWEFTTNPQKVEMFRTWLSSLVADKLLEVSPKFLGKPWLSEYVTLAYDAGTKKAGIDSSFQHEIRTDSLEMIYTRSYGNLKGLGSDIENKLLQVLADGLVRGNHPSVIARKLVKKLNLTKARAASIARSEMANAFAEGQLDGFSSLSKSVRVKLKVEWTTSGSPCPLCAQNAGMVVTIDRAHGLIPYHPNCACIWIPYTEDLVTNSRKVFQVKTLKMPMIFRSGTIVQSRKLLASGLL